MPLRGIVLCMAADFKPVIRRRGRKTSLDVLALNDAILNRLLTRDERDTANRILPGICERLEQMKREHAGQVAPIGVKVHPLNA